MKRMPDSSVILVKRAVGTGCDVAVAGKIQANTTLRTIAAITRVRITGSNGGMPARTGGAAAGPSAGESREEGGGESAGVTGNPKDVDTYCLFLLHTLQIISA